MVRAGIFIGVDRTGKLQKLNDAASGARRMYEWACSQGVNAKLITDENGAKVKPDMILESIQAILDGPGADQLILYFAGHGVNINRGEQWLLSDAPTNANAAVNVTGSVELARYCGFSHVVIISDACRVAPEGIQAQNVRGMDVFPNDPVSDRARPVDQFFACVLGRTAAELKDPAAAASSFCALYTGELLPALKGEIADVLESSADVGDNAYYVRPTTLEDYLERAVPQRVLALNLQNKVNQSPDAIITAHKYWMAKADRLPRTTRSAKPVPAPAPNLRSAMDALVQTAMAVSPSMAMAALSDFQSSALGPEVDRVAETVRLVAEPFGPDHFETQCGIKIQGAAAVRCIMSSAQAELLGTPAALVRVAGLNEPATAIVEFDNRSAAVLAVLPGFIVSLTFEGEELIDVSYEPSAQSFMYDEYRAKSVELRALRAIAASASQHGRFRLDKVEDPFTIARRMQFAKGIDPTLAVYAAYAYYDLQRTDRIQEISSFLRMNLQGVAFFDVALLARELWGRNIDAGSGVVPFVPCFSQGWALLSANRVNLHPALQGAERWVRESMWTLFDVLAIERLENALMSGGVR